ncbi:protein FAR1-RELATED SEQUENCE 5-like [Lotus japonicus]|uniref:protein FAR1-RELATED SEQUENCE 5-like n=1 Tax=Lotus japonicus TaxID=34305 RepID=UPI0025876CB7|nr:protein FAR1-RELATED SEQUENCE 5-like [Lotus japonicus]
MANSTEISYGGTGCLNRNSEQSGSLKDADKMSEDLDELNVEDKNGEDHSVDFEYEEETHIEGTDATIDINNEDDILMIDLKNLCPDKVSMMSFISLDIAYLFYTWYGRVNGFSVRKSSILRSKTSHESGGYENVGFRQKAIYNQVGKQRAEHESDGVAALKYLKQLQISDPELFFRYKENGEGKLEHLFWSDGMSQIDYKAFGEVVAFDATYGKNKYRCPLVFFCGVNHHQQTIVFASAIVGNEKEDAYVWLLQRLMEVMKDKAPTSVITDGDIPMKKAIKLVLPQSHHMLCAWDMEKKWTEMVDKFELHDNGWVQEMYEKRSMWAASHMRGNFFAGFRTTSRCEGHHSKIGKFVNSRCNITELIQHLCRLMNHIRYKEIEANFNSSYGEAVLETKFQNLERSGANVFTREIFSMYRAALHRSGDSIVVGYKETSSQYIFLVSKYRGSGREWHVSFQPSAFFFQCACKKMESMGLPCHHVLAVLVYLDVCELPKCLVLPRWTFFAKDDVDKNAMLGTKHLDSFLISRAIKDCDEEVDDLGNSFIGLKDPNVVRTKGTGCPSPSSAAGKNKGNKRKGSRKCSQCHRYGHNKTTCKRGTQARQMTENTNAETVPTQEESYENVG